MSIDWKKRCVVDNGNDTERVCYGLTAQEYNEQHPAGGGLFVAVDLPAQYNNSTARSRMRSEIERPTRFFFTKHLGKEPIRDNT